MKRKQFGVVKAAIESPWDSIGWKYKLEISVSRLTGIDVEFHVQNEKRQRPSDEVFQQHPMGFPLIQAINFKSLGYSNENCTPKFLSNDNRCDERKEIDCHVYVHLLPTKDSKNFEGFWVGLLKECHRLMTERGGDPRYFFQVYLKDMFERTDVKVRGEWEALCNVKQEQYFPHQI